MPKYNLQRAFQSYLSKIKRETRSMQLSSTASLSRKLGLSRCKHPKTLSFSTMPKRRTKDGGCDDDDEGGDDEAATLDDIDRFLQENFKSLYVDDEDGVDVKGKGEKKTISGEDDGDSDSDEEEEKGPSRRRLRPPPGFDWLKLSDRELDICKLERFIINQGSSEEDSRRSPGRTTTTTTTTTVDEIASSSHSYGGVHQTKDEGCTTPVALPKNCIAVPKHAEDPYEEFRRSMLEMVEAMMVVSGCTVDWDLMEQLLFCYLDLNDKKCHRFILNAFVDVIVLLRRSEHRKDLVGSPISGFVSEKSRRTRHP